MVWSYLPCFFSIIFVVICYYISCFVQVRSELNSPHWIPPLPDIGHRLLPYWSSCSINNHYLIAAYVLVIIRYIFQRNIRLIVFRRCLFLQGVMLSMRTIGSPSIEAFYVMFSIHETCGDLLFSGHAVSLTLCALAWTTYSKGEEYYPIRWLWNRFKNLTGDPLSCYLTTFIIWIFTIIGFIFLIATRVHYTVDVFLGFLLSILAWQTYHYYIKTLAERQNITITRFFIWFEEYRQLPTNTSLSLIIDHQI